MWWWWTIIEMIQMIVCFSYFAFVERVWKKDKSPEKKNEEEEEEDSDEEKH